MRQLKLDCVAVFFLTRRHAQSAELPGLSPGTDDANCEFEFRAALHTSKQFLDLFDGVRFGFAHAINDHTALKSCLVCRAIRFDCGNQNRSEEHTSELQS